MDDLFTEPANLDLEAHLVQVFEDYVLARAQASPAAVRSERPLREKSAAVYRDVWHAFAVFCAGRGVSLDRLDTDTLDNFVAALGDGVQVTPRYVRRVLALIGRVAKFAAKRDGTMASTAPAALLSRARYRYADAALEEDLPAFLNARESARLRTHVTAPQPDPRSDEMWSWQAVRNRTAVALQLGAGITPGEIQGLTVAAVIIAGGSKAGVPWKLRLPANGNSPAHESPIATWAGVQLGRWLEIQGLTVAAVIIAGGSKAGVPWKLRLPANGNSPAHESPIATWAGVQLGRWLKVRLEAQVAGEFVFPSTRSGKPWSKMAFYLACQAVLADAGVHAGAGGTYRLRHTWVLRHHALRQSVKRFVG